MASTYDSCLPMAVESAAEGGTQLRVTPTEMDPTQDAAAVAAVHLVGSSAVKTDKSVYVDRTSASALRLTDATTSHILGELVSSTLGQVGTHDGLHDASHFLADQGPGCGFASGATCAKSYSGVLLTSLVWYTSSAMTQKIWSKTLSYASGAVLPSTCTYVLYDATGAVARQIVDNFVFTGVFLTSVSRNWS